MNLHLAYCPQLLVPHVDFKQNKPIRTDILEVIYDNRTLALIRSVCVVQCSSCFHTGDYRSAAIVLNSGQKRFRWQSNTFPILGIRKFHSF